MFTDKKLIQTIIHSIVTFSVFLIQTEILAENMSRSAKLRSTVIVNQQKVTLKDVLAIGDHKLDRNLLELDLYEFGESEATVTLSKEFINLRVALSSSAKQTVLAGSDQITVTYRPSVALTDQLIELEAAKVVANTMRVGTNDVRVRLLTPVMSQWIGSTKPQTSFAFDFVFQNQPQLGRQTALLRVLDGGRIIGTKRIQIEAATRQPVITLRKSIRRGEILSNQNLEVTSEFRTMAPELNLNDAVGLTVRRNMTRGSILRPQDLEKTQRQTVQPNVIQTRDAVRLVARKNGLKVVVPQAQAMQSGRIGQIIRVKNLESNRIVTGRVVNADEVAIDLH